MSQLFIWQCDYCGVRHELLTRPTWASVVNAYKQELDMCTECEYKARNSKQNV